MLVIDLNKASLGLFAGLAAGVFAGILARIVMRLVTLVAGLRPSFSVEGTMIILIVGATLGIGFGVLFVVLPRRWVPLPDLGKGLLLGVVPRTDRVSLHL